MIRIDTSDGFYGEGFGTGALIDVGPSTYRVLLCVRYGFNSPQTAMHLYVTPS